MAKATSVNDDVEGKTDREIALIEASLIESKHRLQN